MRAADQEMRKELINLMTEINEQILAIKIQADEQGIKPYELRNADGSWPLTQLYLAKAQAWQAYVLLTKGERRSLTPHELRTLEP